MFRYLTSSNLKTSLTSLSLACLLFSCQPAEQQAPEQETTDPNPAAEGFNAAASDPVAIAWADATMKAMGGRDAWDQTRYLSWDFFGRRQLWWDRYQNRVRIEVPADSAIYLVNTSSMDGRVRIQGREVADQDSLTTLLQRAKSMWINDSYWLVMPFKLKDSGVTLRYKGEGTTLSGAPAQVLSLTFEDVGDTPDNKYEVYITKKDSLVKQWAYFKNASQDSASIIWPWDNYKVYGNILLSSDRSDGKGPHDVVVHRELSDSVFTVF